MNSIVNEQLQDYLRQLSKSNDETILELEEFAKNNHIPIVEPEVRQLLKMILLMEQPKSILEIGTAIGYSSIVMKKACPDAKITTVENYEKNANFARENFEKYGYDDIELIFGDGYEVMKNMDRKFDLIFIDAAKGQYIKYFEEAVRLSNKNSVIVCDNVLFRGMVCEKEFYEHRHRKITIVKRLREFLEIISDSSKYDTTIIPIDDGMSITKLK
ncbi:MAG: O-methyltransferase [Finegoldia magna]|uniref:O-methyltransferase n=1 Tax=Finegoldia magna TaxID=1260 RepID=UPI0029038F1C|nr:O-methyltransferase [Finegoldia magna]MDU2639575.1 O-methyltransferase [Finegoldia magna]